MATIDIRLDGVSVTSHVLFARTSFTSVADGNPGTATVVINNDGNPLTTNDISVGTTLELYVDGSREWDGWVMGWSLGWPFSYDDTTVAADTPTFWTIHGYDRNLLFQKRVMLNKANPSSNRGFKIWPADTPDKTAIQHSLDKYVDLSSDGLTWDIEQIDSPSPWEEFTLGYVSAPMGLLFEDCSEMTGGVYWVGPDRKLHYKSDITVTAPWTLSDAPAGSEVGYRDLNAALDYTKAATEALVWGAGKGSADPVFAKYTNTTAKNTYGLWQWGDYYAGAWKQQTVNRRARTYVNGSPTHRRGHDEPVPTVRCIVFTPGLRAGMVVLIVSTLFAYSEALPIRKMTMTFPTPSEVKYELEASLKVDTPFGIPDPWWTDEDGTDTPYREWIGEHGPTPTGGADPDADLLIDHFDDQRLPGVTGETQYTSTGAYFPPPLDEIYNSARNWWIPLPDYEVGDYAYMVLTASNTGAVELNAPWLTGDDYTTTHGDLTNVFKSSAGWASGWVVELTEAGLTGVLAQWAGGANPSPNPGYVWLGIVRGVNSYTTASNFSAQPPLYSDHALTVASEHSNDGAVTSIATAGWSNIWATGGTYGLGVAQRRDNDGSFTLPTWSPDTDYTKVIAFISSAAIEDAILMTPGPEVTAAPWPGGNVWHKGWPSSSDDGREQTATVADSIASDATYLNLYTFDTLTDIVNDTDYGYYYLQPSYENPSYPSKRYPWSGFSAAWWSSGETQDGADLLIKWRHNGPMGSDYMNIHVEQTSIPLVDPTPFDIWMSQQTFTIESNNTSIYPGGGSLPDRWPFYSNPTGYSTNSLVFPFHAYHYNSGPSYAADTWYWTRVQFGAPLDPPGLASPYGAGNPYALHNTGWNLSRMKTWVYGDPEPTTGDSDLFWWYWNYSSFSPPEDPLVPLNEIQTWTTEGWDIALPQAWNTNINPDPDGVIGEDPTTDDHWDIHSYEGRSVLQITGNNFEIDGIWVYGAGTGEVGGTGTTTTDVPIYDNTENTQSSVYITRYPYVPGTLQLWLNGVRLVPGSDFIESEPQAGQFILNEPRDVSSSLLAQYERWGTSETTAYSGGEVYRPAPVLQYGWGSALDGYNCTMAAGCTALDRHTLGQFTPFTGSPRATPPNMRGFQSDQVGGTSLFDLQDAWQNGWGQTLFVDYVSWAGFVDYIDSRRGAVVAGKYGNLPASKRFSDSFTGGHAIYINERFSNGNFWGIDPLYRYPVVYTPTELQDYAVSFISPGLVSAGFTKVTA